MKVDIKTIAIIILLAFIIILSNCGRIQGGGVNYTEYDTVVKIDTILRFKSDTIYSNTVIEKYIRDDVDGVRIDPSYMNLDYDFDISDSLIEGTLSHNLTISNDSIKSNGIKLKYKPLFPIYINNEVEKIVNKEVKITEYKYPFQLNVGGGISYYNEKPGIMLSGGVSFKQNHLNLNLDPLNKGVSFSYMRNIWKPKK